MSAAASDGARRVNALRANRWEIKQILDTLDDVPHESPGKEARSETRHQYRMRLTIAVTQPGGGAAEHEVHTRNLSATGMAFLHNGFLHVGSKCAVRLKTADDALRSVIGTVVHCRHIGGRIHEVAIVFAESLDLSQFIGVKLSGTVLLVDDAPDIAALVSHHLTKGGLQVTVAGDGNRALELVAGSEFDLILMDINMPDMDGLAVTRGMRQRGVSMPIIALTASRSEQTRQACLEAGCDLFLAKPVDREQLLEVIGHYLNPEESITSTHANDPDMADFIYSFVTGLPARLGQLQECLQTRDAGRLLSLARELEVIASSKGGCGFDPISDAATTLEQAVDDTPNWGGAETALAKVADLARRVTFDPPSS